MTLVATPQLYAIMAAALPDKVSTLLGIHFPNNYLAVAPGQWLLVASGITAKEVSDKLGITTGESGNAVVLAATGSYYGRGNPQIWEWLKSRLGSPNG